MKEEWIDENLIFITLKLDDPILSTFSENKLLLKQICWYFYSYNLENLSLSS